MESEEVVELPKVHDKTTMNEELLLLDEQREWVLEMETTPYGDAAKIVEMTARDLEIT